jgi:uncharacterized membrane protein
MLVPPHAPAPDWATNLAASLLHPQFTISLWEAVGRRFRRNYLWIFLTLAASWALKIITQPKALTTWDEFITRAAIGPIGGEIVIAGMIAFLIAACLIGLATVMMRRSVGEVFDETRLDQFIRAHIPREKH